MFKNSDPMTPMTNLVTRWVLSHNLGVATSLAVCRMDDMPPGGQCASLAMASAVSTLGFCSGSTRFTFIDHHRSENSLASQKQRPRPCTMYRKIIVVDLGFRLSSDRTQLASLFCFCFFGLRSKKAGLKQATRTGKMTDCPWHKNSLSTAQALPK